MSRFQPLEIIRGLFAREKGASKPVGTEDLAPLQYLRELNERLQITSGDKDPSPGKVRRRILLAKALAKMAKPLLRFENLLSASQRTGLEMILSQSVNPDVVWALSPGIEVFRKYIGDALDCADHNEKPLVWLAWCVSTDLVLAFEAQPFCTEGLVVFLQVLEDANEKIIDIGEQAGVTPEHCSASKNALGSCISQQLPPPTCVVTSSHPCDSMVSSYQSIKYMTGAPTFMLDTPYWEDERAMDYYTGEIKRLIAFLEEHLDRKLDYDRLREVLTEVNKTNELIMEINEMHRATPCPGTNLSGTAHWFFRVLGLGTPEVTEMAKRLHKISRDRLESGRGMIKDEKIRVIWFDVPVVFYPIQVWMEETFGAVTVIDILSYINTPQIDTSTPESMIRGLAETYINLNMAGQFHGPIDYFHTDLVRVCAEYNGDCFIFPGHAGCKHNWASTRILKNYMKKIDMPLLILTSDIFDQRLTNEDQLKAQIEEFFVSNGLA